MKEINRAPSFGQVLQKAIREHLADLHTAIPARVESYDAVAQKVNVTPLIKTTSVEEDGTSKVASQPMINEVPVVFPGAGGFRFTFPIAAGDTVLLVFSESSIDKWLQQGGEVDPRDTRRFHLSDAVAIPGLHPFSAPWTGASTSDATFGKDGGPQVVAKAAEIHLGADALIPAIDAVIKGTTYRTAETTMNTALSAAMTANATALAAMAVVIAQLSACPAFAAPPGPANLLASATATTAAGTALGAAVTAVTSFEAAAASYLSAIVKTK